MRGQSSICPIEGEGRALINIERENGGLKVAYIAQNTSLSDRYDTPESL